MLKRFGVLASTLVLAAGTVVSAQEAPQLVEQAVQTELAANAADHSRWLYYDVDRKPDHTVKQWVAETPQGDLDRVMEDDGRTLSEQEQRSRMEAFVRDSAGQDKQRKAAQHDDQQATQMLNLLPHAFIWTKTGTQGSSILLHFKPNPLFHPPNYQARVFAAMEGDMAIDSAKHRIVSLKGRLIHEVRFGFGLFGELDAGGTFDVERRQTGEELWQIVETHVHILGRALVFKSISEQEDDEKSKLRRLSGNLTLEEAEKRLLEQGQ